MALLLKHNPNIEGITVNEVMCILSQFADDTVMYLKFDPLTINAVTDVLNIVEKSLGLKVSYEKTKLYRVGSLAKSQAKIYTKQTYLWSNGPIELLGTSIDCVDNSLVIHENYEKVISKVRQVCKDWYYRTLTLFGKVKIVNTLIASLFVYKMNVMLDLTEKQIVEIEQMIRDFLWAGKKDKIPLRILQLDTTQGGLRLVNLRHRQSAFKIKWIWKIRDSDFLKECAYQGLNVGDMRQNIWRCNLRSSDVSKLFKTGENFWAQVLHAWSNINYWSPTTVGEILQQLLWYNSHIRRENLPFYWAPWYRAGIQTIRDLWNVEEHEPYTAAYLSQKHNIDVGWLQLNSVWAAIPQVWKAELYANATDHGIRPDMCDTLGSMEGVTKRIYNMLIDNEGCINTYQKMWCAKGLNIEENEYKILFTNNHLCTKISKYRSFQYKLLLGKIFPNAVLHKWGLVPKCKLQTM